jgi:glucose-1-phosphatase
MPAPQAVIFDLGKVLLDFDYRITVQRIARRCPVTPEEIRRSVDQSPLLHRYETGQVSTEEFFGEVRTLIGYDGPMEEFCRAFGDIFSEIPPMIAWQARLRAAGVPTFILSNTNELAIAHIRERFAFFAGFDGYVYSYEHGAMKPDARLYEVAERLSGVAGAGLFYIDDRPENVEAARARGWRAVVHVGPEETLQAAREAGLPD